MSKRAYTDSVPFPELIQLQPIALIRSPYTERHGTPRQPSFDGSAPVEATVELLDGSANHALFQDLERFDHIWLISWFHLNGNRKKALVRPPRGGPKRGVLSTRAPHRPNALGLTAVRLLAVEGGVLRVQGVDLLDGTPIVDIKPYVAEFDAFPDASRGWLDDEVPGAS